MWKIFLKLGLYHTILILKKLRERLTFCGWYWGIWRIDSNHTIYSHMNILRLAIKQHEHYTIQCCYFKLHYENYCYFSKRHIVYFTTKLCVRLQLMISLNLRDLATVNVYQLTTILSIYHAFNLHTLSLSVDTRLFYFSFLNIFNM